MSTSSPPSLSELAGRARTSGYFVLTLLVLAPLMDVASTAWPAHPSAPAWRFAAAGLLSGALPLVTLGLFLLTLLAFACEDRRVLFTATLVDAMGSVVLFIVAVGFALDVLQMRAQVTPAQMDRFQAASAQALARLVIYGIVLAVLASASWKAARRLARGNAGGGLSGAGRGAMPLVVNQSRSTPATGTPPPRSLP